MKHFDFSVRRLGAIYDYRWILKLKSLLRAGLIRLGQNSQQSTIFVSIHRHSFYNTESRVHLSIKYINSKMVLYILMRYLHEFSYQTQL